uniref:60S ribosomal protein L10a-1 n=1 Tax=Stygiella incarcerata TaxID=1712417 RepID=A0A192ZIA4_9EUKA|nr:60S ribosomal protein L10a-1 [Stygiella incarcerata]|eukprot:TRINITY_DN2851_c0_g2_i1.p1 TRINITY_DN2851_c0_g2~~TRINITY_DN2851_c0_g2_i1.p1  ORF type:complete len:217 (-),score=66.30 TRINITY_DN2851_c0_g2_i1:260-910(-)
MSKLQAEALRESIANILQAAKDKKRNFVETIELQVGLKNYDPQKDKRFSGSIRLPVVCRPRVTVCLIGSVGDVARAEKIGLEYRSIEDLKKLNKNKKLVKKLAKKYNAFIASESLIKMIPRVLGPTLNKMGKFPSPIGPEDDLEDKVREVRSTVKFQLKKVLCMGVAVGNVQMTPEEAERNIVMTVNFLVSLLKKGWQNIKTLHIKTTMGAPERIF